MIDMTPSHIFLAAWVLTDGLPFHVRLRAMLDRKWYEHAAQWLTKLNCELVNATIETDQIGIAMVERTRQSRLHS